MLDSQDAPLNSHAKLFNIERYKELINRQLRPREIKRRVMMTNKVVKFAVVLLLSRIGSDDFYPA